MLTLGRIIITSGALAEFTSDEQVACLARHANGDWGDLCEEDRQVNAHAVERGHRVLSRYKFGTGDRVLWIITESDRYVTTLLRPDEY